MFLAICYKTKCVIRQIWLIAGQETHTSGIYMLGPHFEPDIQDGRHMPYSILMFIKL